MAAVKDPLIDALRVKPDDYGSAEWRERIHKPGVTPKVYKCAHSRFIYAPNDCVDCRAGIEFARKCDAEARELLQQELSKVTTPGGLDGTLTPKQQGGIYGVPFWEAHMIPQPTYAQQKTEQTLDEYFNRVRSSVVEHAQRKGYQDESGTDIAGGMVSMLGLSTEHALCEILYKLVEFKSTPRQVIAEKIAGWSFLLWKTVKD